MFADTYYNVIDALILLNPSLTLRAWEQYRQGVLMEWIDIPHYLRNIYRNAFNPADDFCRRYVEARLKALGEQR